MGLDVAVHVTVARLDLVGLQLRRAVELVPVRQQLLLRPPRRPLPARLAALLDRQRHRHLPVLQLPRQRRAEGCGGRLPLQLGERVLHPAQQTDVPIGRDVRRRGEHLERQCEPPRRLVKLRLVPITAALVQARHGVGSGMPPRLGAHDPVKDQAGAVARVHVHHRPNRAVEAGRVPPGRLDRRAQAARDAQQNERCDVGFGIYRSIDG